MSLPDDFDPTPPKLPKQPALVVDPIYGVLPYDGFRNPLTRSNTAQRVSMAIATPATGTQRKVYHFESASEAAVTLDALLSPDLYRLEVQLPPVLYWDPKLKKMAPHHFDLRLTFFGGHRRAVFVRNGSSLATRETKDEIDAIFQAIPCEFADDAIVVNGDNYTRAHRDNLHRIWYICQQSDPDADLHVEEIARSTQFWLLKDLIKKCDLPKATAWRSAMRLIGRKVLMSDWRCVIDINSKVWLNG